MAFSLLAVLVIAPSLPLGARAAHITCEAASQFFPQRFRCGLVGVGGRFQVAENFELNPSLDSLVIHQASGLHITIERGHW